MIYTLIAGVALIVILVVLGEVAGRAEAAERTRRLADLNRCIGKLDLAIERMSPAPRPPREP